MTDLNSRNGTLYNGVLLSPGVVVPIREGEPIAIGMCVIGVGDKCSEQMVPVFESVGITSEIEAESGIFQVHRDKTNQKKLELLYKVSRLLDKKLPVKTALEKMLCYIFDLLREVDTGAFILIEPRSEKIMDVISRTKEPADDRSTEYCPDVVRQVIEERRPLIFSNVETEEEVDLISTLKIHKIQSVLCAPLISHSYIMGAIYIDSKKGAFAFSKADTSLFVDLCKRTALFLLQAQGTFESRTLADSFHPDAPLPF